jgi:hypothetical protein
MRRKEKKRRSDARGGESERERVRVKGEADGLVLIGKGAI